jgi:predicted secreted protein
MAGILPGKLVAAKINGTYIRCQMDITLTMTQDVTDDEACKPSETDNYKGGSWKTHTKGDKGWTMSTSGKMFADVVAGEMSNQQISQLFIDGDNSIEVVVQTKQTADYDFASVILYEGTGTIVSHSINGPADGNATWDMEVTGNGPLTYLDTPFVPTP